MKKKMMMQKRIVVALLVISIMTCTGCSKNTVEEQTSQTSVSTGAPTITEADNAAQEDGSASEFTIGEKKLSYAKNFMIEYLENDNKLITDGAGKQFLLLQQGAEAPAEYASLPTITIPISNVIYTYTTAVGFLRAFSDDSVFDSIVGVRAAVDDWDFDAMKSRMKSGQIIDIGSNTTTDVSYDYEKIQSLNPSLVFTNAGMSDEQTKLMDMLEKAGITYVFDGSSTETDYRGTMEWMKFYTAFYNLENEADTYFANTMTKVDNVIQTASAILDDEKVKVGWGIVANGTIYVENGGSKSAQMVRDCGGEYIFSDIGADTDGVTEISAEEFYKRLSTADVFINRSMPKYSSSDVSSITAQLPELEKLPLFTTEGMVFQITDSYWNSYHNIDEKYIELSELLYPDKFDFIMADVMKHFQIMTITK